MKIPAFIRRCFRFLYFFISACMVMAVGLFLTINYVLTTFHLLHEKTSLILCGIGTAITGFIFAVIMEKITEDEDKELEGRGK